MRILEAYTHTWLVALLLSSPEIRSFNKGEELTSPATLDGTVFQLFHANPTRWHTTNSQYHPNLHHVQIGTHGLMDLTKKTNPIAIIDFSQMGRPLLGYVVIKKDSDIYDFPSPADIDHARVANHLL